MNRHDGNYAAISDPPPGARPARDTGVPRMDATEAKLRDYFRLIGQVADWKAEANRLQRIAVARSEESDAFERERDEALQERDRARELHREEKERADLLAEALHGAYVTEHRWRVAYEEALAAAGDCLKKEEEEGPSPANLTVGEQSR